MSEILQAFEREQLVKGFRSVIEDFPDFVELSRDTAFNRSESYRGFEVGNVGVGISPGCDDLIVIEGANYKQKYTDEHEALLHHPEDMIEGLHDELGIARETMPVCAEMDTLLRMEIEIDPDTRQEFDQVFFLAHFITATTDRDEIRDVTKMDTKTLTPCSACTRVVDESPHIGKATLFISAGLDRDVFQVRNLRVLKQLQKEVTAQQAAKPRQLRKLASEKKDPLRRFSEKEVKRALEFYDVRTRRHISRHGAASYGISSIARAALKQMPATQ